MKNINKNESNTPILGFTYLSRQKHSHIVVPNELDPITLGLYYEDGCCDAEMSISWKRVQKESVPCIMAFSDAFHLFKIEAFKKLFCELSQLKNTRITSDEISRLLIRIGFKDMSEDGKLL